jgi:putative membrane protein
MIQRTVRSLCATALAVLLCGVPATAQNGTVYTLSPDKPENGFYGKSTRNPVPAEHAMFADWQPFVNQAAQDSLAEVRLGELALQKASSDRVKEFAQHMIDDHSKANQELAGLVGEKGLTVPSQPAAKHMALYNRLSRLEGAAFDRAYMKAMVEDHIKAVAMFEKHGNNGRNTDLRMWVASTTPKLRRHLEMAYDVASDVGMNTRMYRRGRR